jgi:hypothetical protein
MAEAKETGCSRTIAAVLLGIGGVGLALSILAWQSYVWLKTGEWPDLTMATVFLPRVSSSDFYLWFIEPKSWYGLHVVVKFLLDFPLWAWSLFLSGGAIPLAKN